MKFYFHDYNFNENFTHSNQDTLIELDLVIKQLDIHLKNSDQKEKSNL